MTPEQVMNIGRQAIEMTLILSAPLLLAALVIGLVISIFQAVTQVHEMTLAFVPKIIAVMLALLVAAPWMIDLLVNFTHNLFTNIPNYIK